MYEKRPEGAPPSTHHHSTFSNLTFRTRPLEARTENSEKSTAEAKTCAAGARPNESETGFMSRPGCMG